MQEVPNNKPAEMTRMFLREHRKRVSAWGSFQDRRRGRSPRADREMSVCEMQRRLARADTSCAPRRNTSEGHEVRGRRRKHEAGDTQRPRTPLHRASLLPHAGALQREAIASADPAGGNGDSAKAVASPRKEAGLPRSNLRTHSGMNDHGSRKCSFASIRRVASATVRRGDPEELLAGAAVCPSSSSSARQVRAFPAWRCRAR